MFGVWPRGVKPVGIEVGTVQAKQPGLSRRLMMYHRGRVCFSDLYSMVDLEIIGVRNLSMKFSTSHFHKEGEAQYNGI